LQMLRDEFELSMALAGCTTVKDINRSHVQTEAERFASRMWWIWIWNNYLSTKQLYNWPTPQAQWFLWLLDC
jgi:hypothetical protein